MSLNEDQQRFMNELYQCKIAKVPFNYILCGAAGTGKSYLIKKIIDVYQEELNIIILTHQAITARFINGMTIMKFFSLSNSRWARVRFENYTTLFEKIDDRYEKRKDIYDAGTDDRKFLVENTLKNLIIIDEISFVATELLDNVNNVLKEAFDTSSLFGGINIILMGDFYQLKPVGGTPLYEMKDGHYIKNFKLFMLKIQERMKNVEFLNLCEAVKKGTLKSGQKKLLLSRMCSPDAKEIQNITHIYPTLDLCNEYNKKKLNSIQEKPICIQSKNTFLDDSYSDYVTLDTFKGLKSKIIIKKTASVMVTVNHNNLCNGEIGFVTSIIEPDDGSSFPKIYVTFPQRNNEDILITPISRSIIDHDVVQFERTMIPLELCWAISTHKSQGMTLDKVAVNLGEKIFDPVQIYISITRVRDINNLYIIKLKDIQRSKDYKKIEQFLNSLTPV